MCGCPHSTVESPCEAGERLESCAEDQALMWEKHNSQALCSSCLWAACAQPAC